ncbi:MAG: flavin reductase family protein [Pantoea sp.]|uniref:flavin reductase family protein n=1 Tax=Pantoea sp. TaxID=69393 RepID=UPI002393DD0B|nr:flavin reductase family protein [Pantoea sp.]MDE1186875.1 flavin reductase family protein [Pantoea sp.]
MTDFIRVDGEGLPPEDAYRLLTGCVVPRPVAWITTVDAQGRVNVAPFSSYNYLATQPPMLGVNIQRREAGAHKGEAKDTARNIRETGQFVVNVSTEATLQKMHASGSDFAPGVSESEELDIPLLPSAHVKPPRIAIAPVQMECQLAHEIPLGKGVNTLFIGEVVAFHLSPEIYDGKHVDSVKMRPIARLGGPFYSALGEIFSIKRLYSRRRSGRKGTGPCASCARAPHRAALAVTSACCRPRRPPAHRTAAGYRRCARSSRRPGPGTG